ncbi:MAG: nucleotidyl transferase AbiEii/AbiGii toxin family protein [Paracoccaceae bacterium]|nr:nucleotidyl transferase AbiEii/AbiGii toxin family protein [Paracoccaceae bacterium]
MDAFATFLGRSEQDRTVVFAVAAQRIGTVTSYIGKDFWVCLVLDALFNRGPSGHPELLFKGGTSLSKAFGFIRRFSEDIDLVVDRVGLGFAGESDPTAAETLSNKKCGKHCSANSREPAVIMCSES